MALPALPQDFKEFLRLLNSHHVDYLLIGGYAVAVHGHVRATNDLDVWIRITKENAARVESALRAFGFVSEALSVELFLAPNQIIRMGVPPLRIEILTSVSGVDFDTAFSERTETIVDGLPIPVIGLRKLRENKTAAGSAKDLAPNRQTRHLSDRNITGAST